MKSYLELDVLSTCSILHKKKEHANVSILRPCPFVLMYQIPPGVSELRQCIVTSTEILESLPRWITENIPNIVTNANPFVRRAIGEAIRADISMKFRNRLRARYTEKDSRRWGGGGCWGKAAGKRAAAIAGGSWKRRGKIRRHAGRSALKTVVPR